MPVFRCLLEHYNCLTSWLAYSYDKLRPDVRCIGSTLQKQIQFPFLNETGCLNLSTPRFGLGYSHLMNIHWKTRIFTGEEWLILTWQSCLILQALLLTVLHRFNILAISLPWLNPIKSVWSSNIRNTALSSRVDWVLSVSCFAVYTNARDVFFVLLWPLCLNCFRKSPHIQ